MGQNLESSLNWHSGELTKSIGLNVKERQITHFSNPAREHVINR
jgi:hypothetical protein